MRQTLLLILLLTAGLIGFIGYCYALIDWIQDANTGVYAHNYQEAIGETTALVGYTYLALRFLFRNRIRF